MLTFAAITGVTAACGVTAFYFLLPRVPANAAVVDIARTFLVEARLKNDFDYLVQHSLSAGQPLAPLLVHLDLADRQRHQYYADLEDSIFRDDVLSPEIDPLPLPEAAWRHTLWDHFYPQVRQETDPLKAAQIVVRSLRERVGIDPDYNYRVGVETIWTEQMTDETGFERIYVAALRSIGIAARLDAAGKVELLENAQWRAAPRPEISLFEDKPVTVPKGGLVNFSN